MNELFERLKQIVGELVKEEVAQPARGRLRLDRLLRRQATETDPRVRLPDILRRSARA